MKKKNEKNKEQDPTKFVDYMNNLINEDYDEYMKLCYIVITQDFSYSKEDPYQIDIKLEAISKMILHFEANEDYEKCGKLKELEAFLTQ